MHFIFSRGFDEWRVGPVLVRSFWAVVLLVVWVVLLVEVGSRKTEAGSRKLEVRSDTTPSVTSPSPDRMSPTAFYGGGGFGE